jgi:predicted permease
MVLRLYRMMLWLLPGRVRSEDGEEIAWVFGELLRTRRGFVSHGLLVVKAFASLPWIAALEWKDRFVGSSPQGPDRNPGGWGMSQWTRNLRYALRTLRRSPAFAFTTVILLGLGVGAVTTIFTVVDHVVLRPLPYPAAERLLLIDNGSHSGLVFRELQGIATVERWGAARSETANLVWEGDPIRIQETKVSEDFLSLFGARPALGRLLVPDDFADPNVVVISHGAWQRIFGSAPDILGRTLRVDGASVMVVGVLEEAFVPPEEEITYGGVTDFWRPIDWSFEDLFDPETHILEIVGRMAPGLTLADVNLEVDRVAADLARRHPDQMTDGEGNPYPIPAASLQEITTRRVRAGLGLLLGAVSILLLVACLNVAHLFLARGLGRVREMAVRRALGAGTSSLIQQLLVESLVLGTAGGAVGVGLAKLGLESFLALNPGRLPRTGDVAVDLRILGFTAAVSVGTVLLFGMVPALRSIGHDLTNDLKGSSRGSTSGRGAGRMRGALVIAEVALSLVLVAQAGLLLRSFMRAQTLDPGIRVGGVWTIPLNPTGVASPEEYVLAMDEVEASLAAVPGVSSAGYSLTLPFEMTGRGRCCWMTSRLSVDGEGFQGLRLLLQPVTEGFFRTLDIPMVSGRIWDEGEAVGEPWPAVISEVLAIEIFGSAQAAVGRTMGVGGDGTPVLVTGVSGDTHHFGLDQDPPLFVYLPIEKLPFTIPMAHMAVSVQGEAPPGWARTLREAVWEVAPQMPAPTVRSMVDWIERSTARRRFDSALFGTFGVVALLLAAAGLYGTLLFTVGQRRRELGIRIALGAGRGSVEWGVVSKGVTLAILGSGLGLFGSWGVGRFIESRLFGLEPTDPGTLLGAVAVLMMAAFLASWLPARRAARVDPMEVLREE